MQCALFTAGFVCLFAVSLFVIVFNLVKCCLTISALASFFCLLFSSHFCSESIKTIIKI